MKFKASREKVLKALQKVISTVGARSTLPVLSNVLLEAEATQLSFTTTDLEIRITTQIEAEIEVPGSTTIPAKKFLALVSKFTDDDLYFSSNERHHAELVCGSSKFKLLGLPAEDPFWSAPAEPWSAVKIWSGGDMPADHAVQDL